MNTYLKTHILDVDDFPTNYHKFYNKFHFQAVDQMITMQSKCGSIVNVLTSINNELDDYWLSKRSRVAFEAYHSGQEIV